MSLISAGSISLDSTFKCKYKKFECEWGGGMGGILKQVYKNWHQEKVFLVKVDIYFKFKLNLFFVTNLSWCFISKGIFRTFKNARNNNVMILRLSSRPLLVFCALIFDQRFSQSSGLLSCVRECCFLLDSWNFTLCQPTLLKNIVTVPVRTQLVGIGTGTDSLVLFSSFVFYCGTNETINLCIVCRENPPVRFDLKCATTLENKITCILDFIFSLHSTGLPIPP